MSRKNEKISREDFLQIIHDSLSPEDARSLIDELESWEGGDTCESVEFSVDKAGRIDSMSGPRPS